jgi:hypothetical protein
MQPHREQSALAVPLVTTKLQWKNLAGRPVSRGQRRRASCEHSATSTRHSECGPLRNAQRPLSERCPGSLASSRKKRRDAAAEPWRVVLHSPELGAQGMPDMVTLTSSATMPTAPRPFVCGDELVLLRKAP